MQTVDAATCARVASLAAHGLSDGAIVDTLLLSIDQVLAVKKTDAYKQKYSDTASDIIERQVNLDEGWDLIEEQSVAILAKTLEYNRDPKFALFAAKTANAVKRRGKSAIETAPIINAQKTTNVISITLNRNFITKNSNGEERKTIDIMPRQAEQPLKIVDLPSPKSVESLLAPVRTKGRAVFDELEEAMNIAGVFQDE